MGRSRTCDIFIADVRASRQQARFFRDEKQALWIEDLGSLNGSYVNGKQIDRVALKEGDIVRLGSTDFLVQNPQSSSIKIVDSVLPENAKMVKQMTGLTIPSLETMHANDYFRAIGVTEEIKTDQYDDVDSLLRQTKNFATLFEISKIMQREQNM